MAVAIGDLDNNGRADIVVANSQSNTFTLLLNQGDGTLGGGGPHDSTGEYPAGIAIADVDGNGNRDVVVANRSGGTLSVFRGNGNGSFAAPVQYPAGSQPWRVLPADLDGDGRMDFVVANGPVGGSGFFVLLQQPGGAFASAVHYALGCGDPALALSVRGAITTAGVRHYQTWYRNAAPFCTPSGFNLTNGLSVLWAP